MIPTVFSPSPRLSPLYFQGRRKPRSHNPEDLAKKVFGQPALPEEYKAPKGKNDLTKLVHHLGKQARSLVELWYGLNGVTPVRSYEELGQKLQIRSATVTVRLSNAETDLKAMALQEAKGCPLPVPSDRPEYRLDSLVHKVFAQPELPQEYQAGKTTEDLQQLVNALDSVVTR